MIKTESTEIKTKGNTELINITKKVQEKINNSKVSEGFVNIFVRGTTAALAINEYEQNLLKDIKEFFEENVKRGKNYHHDDGNAHSHLRASLFGPTLTIPFKDGKLLLGTWQQIILVDFDIRPREREVVVQIIGE